MPVCHLRRCVVWRCPPLCPVICWHRADSHPPRETDLDNWAYSIPALEAVLPRDWQTPGADRSTLDALLLRVDCKDAAEGFAAAAILMQCVSSPCTRLCMLLVLVLVLDACLCLTLHVDLSCKFVNARSGLCFNWTHDCKLFKSHASFVTSNTQGSQSTSSARVWHGL